jgi:hypothetical protein
MLNQATSLTYAFLISSAILKRHRAAEPELSESPSDDLITAVYEQERLWCMSCRRPLQTSQQIMTSKCAAPMVTAVIHNDEWHATAHTQQACVKPGVLQLQGGICICLQRDRGAAAKERGWIAGAAVWKGARSD